MSYKFPPPPFPRRLHEPQLIMDLASLEQDSVFYPSQKEVLIRLTQFTVCFYAGSGQAGFVDNEPDKTNSETESALVFRPIDLTKQITSVACGKEHALLLTIAGDVYSLGSGRYFFFFFFLVLPIAWTLQSTNLFKVLVTIFFSRCLLHPSYAYLLPSLSSTPHSLVF